MKRTIKSEDRAAWLSERSKGVGSSEVAAILGVSPYMTAFELWRRKTEGGDAEDGTNLRFAIGHDLEERVAETFEAVTGNKVDKRTAGDFIVYDTESPHMRVSPDRYYKDAETGETGILECKTTTRPIDPDDIPMQYFCQVQYQMGVAGVSVATLAWIDLMATGDGFSGFGHVVIKFDPDFFVFMKARVDEFWACVTGKTPPPPTNARDAARVYPESVDEAREAENGIADDVMRLKELNERIKALETEAGELKDRIAVAFGEAERLSFCGKVIATYKTQRTTRLDTRRLKQEQPGLYEEFSKEGSTRVLRIK